MSKKRLSSAQESALKKFEAGQWQSSYDLGVSLPTLDALYKKGLVLRKLCSGYYSFPNTNILYKCCK